MKAVMATVALAVIAVVAGLSIGRMGASAPEPTENAQADADARAENEQLRVSLDHAETERAQALRERDQFEGEVDALEATVKRLEAELAKLRTSEVPEEVIAAALGIEFGEYGDLAELTDADWEKMAGAVLSMQSSIAELAALLDAGGEMSQELGLEIAKENQKLVQFALAIADKLPTNATNFNGEYTHPVAQMNLMAEVLSQSNTPLSDAQRRALASLGDRYEQEWNSAQDSYGDDVSQLEMLLDEVALKQTILDDIEGQLSPAQVAQIFPEATRGRASLDLFSPALMMMGSAQALQVESVDQLKGTLQQRASAFLGVSQEELARHDAIFQTWVDDVSGTMQPANQFQANSYDVETGLAAGRAQLRAVEALANALNLDPETRAALMENGSFFIPHLPPVSDE